MEKLDR